MWLIPFKSQQVIKLLKVSSVKTEAFSLKILKLLLVVVYTLSNL